MNNLKLYRTRKGMTQLELAIKVQEADPTIDQAKISFLENGDVYPGRELLKALSTALDVAPEALWDGFESMFVPTVPVDVSATTKRMTRLIPHGKENAVTRDELRRFTGWGDRVLRENIERARNEGVVIANDQDGKGYYRPVTREEMARLYRSNQNRALSILRQQKHIRERLNDGY